jgi:hypothetical protein
MQNVSDRQDSDEKPPPGGSVVSIDAHPAAWVTGTVTVVGTADSVVEVVEGGAVDGTFRAEVWAAVGDAPGDAQAQPTRARTARVSGTLVFLRATCLPRLG